MLRIGSDEERSDHPSSRHLYIFQLIAVGLALAAVAAVRQQAITAAAVLALLLPASPEGARS